MSLVSANSSDLETKIGQLEKINFDLKMRIFHLNDQLSGTNKGNSMIADNGIAEKVVDLLRERDITVIQTKEAHDISLRRIAELESELSQLKITRGIDTSLTTSKSFVASSSELAESLKREREACNAIAEHDATLIMSLEQEVISLRNQHETNTKLISEYAQREYELKELLMRKQFEFEQTSQQLFMSKELLESMEDKMRQQMPSGLKPFHTSNGDKSPLKGRSSSQHLPTFSNSYNTTTPSRSDRYTSSNVRSSVTSDSTPNLNNYGSRSVSFQQQQLGGSSSTGHVLFSTDPAASMSTYDESIPDMSKPLVHQALAGELLNLRRENGLLRAQLERDRESMIAQEHSMATARSAAEELTMLEAEEIARLEGDLERSNRDRDRWQALYKKAEAISETLRQEIFALERREEERELEKYQLMQVQDLVTYAGGSGHARSSPTGRNRPGSGHRGQHATSDRDRGVGGSDPAVSGRSNRRRKGEDLSWDQPQQGSRMMYPSSDRTPISTSMSPKRNHQELYHQSTTSSTSNGRLRNGPPQPAASLSSSFRNAVKSPLTPDTPQGNFSELPSTNNTIKRGTSVDNNDVTPSVADDKMARMYRQREEELLEALEGVVRRCRTLETKLGI